MACPYISKQRAASRDVWVPTQEIVVAKSIGVWRTGLIESKEKPVTSMVRVLVSVRRSLNMIYFSKILDDSCLSL